MFGTFCSVFTSRGDYIFYMIVSNEYFEIIEPLYGKLWTLIVWLVFVAYARERTANFFADFRAVIACTIETRSEWQYNRPKPILWDRRSVI